MKPFNFLKIKNKKNAPKTAMFFSIAFFLLFGVGVFTFALLSCGANKKNADTTIDFWVQFTEDTDEGVVFSKLLTEFSNAHPDIPLRINFIPRGGGGSGYEDKLNSAVITGGMPDLFTFDGPNNASYAEAGVSTKLTGLIEQEFVDGFLPSIIQQGNYLGELYSLGYMESGTVIYYNKKHLSLAGITEDQLQKYREEGYTVADLLTMSKQVRDYYLQKPAQAQKNNFEIAMNMGMDTAVTEYEWGTYFYTPFVWSVGGRLIGDDGLSVDGIFNSAQNVDALTEWQLFFSEKLVSLSPSEQAFELGKMAFTFGGIWFMADFNKNYPELNYGILPYPVVEKNHPGRYASTGSWAIAISEMSPNKEAAAKVLKWFTSDRSSQYVFETVKMLPARKNTLESILTNTQDGDPILVFLKQLQQKGKARPSTPGYPFLSSQFNDALLRIARGSDVEETLNSKIVILEKEFEKFHK